MIAAKCKKCGTIGTCICKFSAQKIEEFESISEHYITGRGQVFVVLSKSQENLVNKAIKINGEFYKVNGVETQGYAKIGDKIALLVTKI